MASSHWCGNYAASCSVCETVVLFDQPDDRGGNAVAGGVKPTVKSLQVYQLCMKGVHAERDLTRVTVLGGWESAGVSASWPALRVIFSERASLSPCFTRLATSRWSQHNSTGGSWLHVHPQRDAIDIAFPRD